MSDPETGAGGSKTDAAALTRATAAQSKELWKKCTDLVSKYHEDLETWLMDRPVANFKTLEGALKGDLLDQDVLWRVHGALQTVKQDLLTHRQKISRIEKVTNQLEAEILNAPSSLDPRETDTSNTRQIYVIELRSVLQEVNDVYNASEAKYKRYKTEQLSWAFSCRGEAGSRQLLWYALACPTSVYSAGFPKRSSDSSTRVGHLVQSQNMEAATLHIQPNPQSHPVV